MKKKNRKFATTFLTTALLTCGFTLETTSKPQPEEQTSTEVCVTSQDSNTQDLVTTTKRKANTKTGQPSPENAPTSHGKPPQKQPSPLPEEPDTDEPDTQNSENILQKILNNTYEFNGDEVIYTETAIIYITFPTAEELQPVYINGFGWVEPSNEPIVRIQALDMIEYGVKVGNMGG
ncbi:MAG: hypothetical protein R3Y63_15540 [Eubacteriales bacterium]